MCHLTAKGDNVLEKNAKELACSIVPENGKQWELESKELRVN
jgi:hypothetical protein